MQISYAGLLGWALPFGLASCGLGAYPTWVLAGEDGLRAQAVSLAVVLAIVLASGALLCRAAGGGAGRAAVWFIFSCLGRVVVALALILAAWKIWDLKLVALLVWMVAFYLALLTGEAIWLTRALRRDARLQAPSRPAET